MASVKAGIADRAIEPKAAMVAMPLSGVLMLPRTQPELRNTKNALMSRSAAELIAAAILCATNSEYFMAPEP